MALVTAKNGELFRAWIAYLCKKEGKEFSTPSIRTEAFFNQYEGKPVPLFD